MCTPLSGSDQGARPITIPALQQWQSGKGNFVFSSASRIVAPPGLLNEASTLAEDLAQMFGQAPPIVSSRATAGDIVLMQADCGGIVGDQGYGFSVGQSAVIVASTNQGVFYGTRTLLQLLHQSRTIPQGEARDWPDYPERALMLDVARQSFSANWIEQFVRQIAYFKFTQFHLHLTDDQGFRVESDKFPEVVSAEHFSKADIAAIVALGAQYHIEIIPEIEMPGHCGAILAAHPEFLLKNAAGVGVTSYSEDLDVTNDSARAFVSALIEDILPQFPGRYWHIGGDEIMPNALLSTYPQLTAYGQKHYGPTANAKDTIHGFQNDIAALLESHGKIPRMWHDEMLGGAAVTLDPNIVVEWWGNSSPYGDLLPITPQAVISSGHPIMNVGYYPNYYDSTGPLSIGPLQPNMQTAYESWAVNEFDGILGAPPNYTIAPNEPANLGGQMAIWNGGGVSPVTDAQIAQAIEPRLRVLGQKYWQSPLLVPSYAGFQTVMQIVGDAPGFVSPQ
jgi:hexosaminidase